MSLTYHCSQLNQQKQNKKVILNGWIRRIRKLGNLLFFDLHDFSGSVQVIVKNKNLIDLLKKLNSETLLKISGIVRPKVSRNQQQQEVEIELEKYQIINETKLLPFEIKDEININEDTRFRYRYLDLRRNISKKPLIVRHNFLHHVRNYLYQQGFIEVETPILAQNSPEGANCFVVPAALGKQRYYTLPQSPQMFKQLLMMSGFDKHYQIDKSFRNEDARSNRQIEFSQLDLEMSFTSTKKIMKLTEKFLKNVLKKSFNCQLKTPFTILTYQQAIEKYGTDKPDFVEEEDELTEDEKKFAWKKYWAIVYYDKDYHSAEKEDKTTSLLDTLSDGGEQQIEQQIQQEEIKIKVNKYFSRLEFHEELIIRLFFGIEPKEPDLEDQIIRLATEEKVKELKKIKKRKIPSDEAGKVYPLLEKYRKFLAVSRQKEEVIQEFMQLEFWEYFHEFPEFSLKPESSRRGGTKKTKLTEAKQTTEQEKWKETSFSKPEISRWIKLGYQPEDASDFQNQILQKLGISKKEKEQWKKTGNQAKPENWLEIRLGKVIENRKKNILAKLKESGGKK